MREHRRSDVAQRRFGGRKYLEIGVQVETYDSDHRGGAAFQETCIRTIGSCMRLYMHRSMYDKEDRLNPTVLILANSCGSEPGGMVRQIEWTEASKLERGGLTRRSEVANEFLRYKSRQWKKGDLPVDPAANGYKAVVVGYGVTRRGLRDPDR